MRDLIYSPGQSIGGWTLLQLLGGGGNAEVWEATPSRGSSLALKILRQRNRHSEPFKRFESEIEVLRRLGGHNGIVPMLGSNIPSQISKDNPAWYSMPVATNIKEALASDGRLETLVLAISSIAQTLAEIAKNFGIFHRDIKPENLYILDGTWSVSDFGLAYFPDKDAITKKGALLGSQHYIAPEIFSSQAADPGPADVYALAKTLWVLGSRQNFPLPGVLDREEPRCRLSSFITHERLRPIELLLDLSTNIDPIRRPSMLDFAAELQAWGASRTNQALNAPNLDLVAKRLRPIISHHIDAEKRRRGQQEHVISRLAEIGKKLEILGEAVRRISGLNTEYGAWSVFSDSGIIPHASKIPDYSYQHHVATHFTSPRIAENNIGAVVFTSGIALVCKLNGQIDLVAAHVLQEGHDKPRAIWTARSGAIMQSSIEDAVIDRLIGELMESLPAALDRWSEALSR